MSNALRTARRVALTAAPVVFLIITTAPTKH
jgi:hypothetical protein